MNSASFLREEGPEGRREVSARRRYPAPWQLLPGLRSLPLLGTRCGPGGSHGGQGPLSQVWASLSAGRGAAHPPHSWDLPPCGCLSHLRRERHSLRVSIVAEANFLS